MSIHMKREIKRAPDLLESALRPRAVGDDPRLILHCPASLRALPCVLPHREVTSRS